MTNALPRFEEPHHNDNNELKVLCPSCGGNYTHHTQIEVFNRRKEDAPDGQRTTITGDTVTVSTDMLGNPSDRRDGLTIGFWCEICHATFELKIAQDKGATYITEKVTGTVVPTDENGHRLARLV